MRIVFTIVSNDDIHTKVFKKKVSARARWSFVSENSKDSLPFQHINRPLNLGSSAGSSDSVDEIG